MGSTQAIKQAIRAGFGISLISRRAVEDECRARLLGACPCATSTCRARFTW
jgi:DNA-binding transcriptional LysR family regulator